MHDPGLQSLRRAARVALVVPVLFAVFLNVVDNSVAALFASFGSFAFLGFADFGGPPRRRSEAYLVLVAVGAALVVLGTLVSNEALIAAVLGVVVASVARFAGCFGGYFGASVSPVILAYVLAASVPSPMSELDDRLLGWVAAGIVATLAALVLWPRRERMLVREAAAKSATLLADAFEAIAAPGGATEEQVAAVDRANADLIERASVPRRPDGPSAHDAALAFLVDQLERGRELVRHVAARREAPRRSAELMVIAARAMRAVEETLRTGAAPAAASELVKSCLETKRTVLERAAADLGRGEPVDAVLDEIDQLFTERLALLLGASALANASVVVSGAAPPEASEAIPLDVPAGLGTRGALSRLRTLVTANAVPASAWAQESVRSGVAVGAAILIAGELRLDHGFWVVLGTLSVLRSNAFATGRTALMAAIGTAVGFAISAGLLGIVGFDDAVLWGIVVAGFFLSAYTPQVVGFIAGQVSFTIAVVAMFNLIEPQGWQTGLVRVENIVIGSSVSAVVALLFWPRRASVGLRANVAALYRDLSQAVSKGVVDPDDFAPVRNAELRAHASYVQYLSETARAPANRRPWATLLAEAAQVRFAVESMKAHHGVVRFDRCGPTRTALRASVQDVASALDGAATLVASPGSAPPTGVDIESTTATTRVPIRECLAHHAHDGGPDGPLAAGLDAAIVRDLILEIGALADDALETAPTAPN
jgi:uncharacterized membrane protein YccC